MESYEYKGKKYNTIKELAKAANVSELTLSVTIEDRDVEDAINDARKLEDAICEICDDLNNEMRNN